METLASADLIRDDEIFLRMNLAERIQHILLIITFTILIATGLPLIFYELKIFKSLMSFERAFSIRGFFHRLAAVVLIVNIVWHFLYTILTERGRNNFKEMIPKFKDARDISQSSLAKCCSRDRWRPRSFARQAATQWIYHNHFRR